jgi:hypothetical protein
MPPVCMYVSMYVSMYVCNQAKWTTATTTCCCIHILRCCCSSSVWLWLYLLERLRLQSRGMAGEEVGIKGSGGRGAAVITEV